MKRVILQSAYVLHRRSYRETSCLLELFTQDHGRLTVVAKGVRKQGSSVAGLLQPFTSLLISWSGKGELKALSQVEVNGQITPLAGECLFAGFYLNELLMCLLHKWDAHPHLYLAYQKAMADLYQYGLKEKILRAFEKCLLEELGYGLLPKGHFSLNQGILADQYYRFVPGEGFQLSAPSETLSHFSGKNLLSIAKEEWEDEACLRDAKRLARLILLPLLGEKAIHSRRLFIKSTEELS